MKKKIFITIALVSSIIRIAVCALFLQVIGELESYALQIPMLVVTLFIATHTAYYLTRMPRTIRFLNELEELDTQD